MRKAIIIALVLLAACSRGPEAPSAQENGQLNEAEAMLDEMAANEAAAD